MKLGQFDIQGIQGILVSQHLFLQAIHFLSAAPAPGVVGQVSLESLHKIQSQQATQCLTQQSIVLFRVGECL